MYYSFSFDIINCLFTLIQYEVISMKYILLINQHEQNNVSNQTKLKKFYLIGYFSDAKKI